MPTAVVGGKGGERQGNWKIIGALPTVKAREACGLPFYFFFPSLISSFHLLYPFSNATLREMKSLTRMQTVARPPEGSGARSMRLPFSFGRIAVSRRSPVSNPPPKKGRTHRACCPGPCPDSFWSKFLFILISAHYFRFCEWQREYFWNTNTNEAVF